MVSPFPDDAVEGEVAEEVAAPAAPVDGEEEAAAADELYIAFASRKEKGEEEWKDVMPFLQLSWHAVKNKVGTRARDAFFNATTYEVVRCFLF